MWSAPTSLGKRTEKLSDYVQSRAEEFDNGPSEKVQKEVLINVSYQWFTAGDKEM